MMMMIERTCNVLPELLNDSTAVNLLSLEFLHAYSKLIRCLLNRFFLVRLLAQCSPHVRQLFLQTITLLRTCSY